MWWTLEFLWWEMRSNVFDASRPESWFFPWNASWLDGWTLHTWYAHLDVRPFWTSICMQRDWLLDVFFWFSFQKSLSSGFVDPFFTFARLTVNEDQWKSPRPLCAVFLAKCFRCVTTSWDEWCGIRCGTVGCLYQSMSEEEFLEYGLGVLFSLFFWVDFMGTHFSFNF